MRILRKIFALVLGLAASSELAESRRLAKCADDPSWRKADGGVPTPKKGCPWVARAPAHRPRCHKTDVNGRKARSACPVTCGTCPACDGTCCDGADWLSKGRPTKGCPWVARNPQKRCRKRDQPGGVKASAACPVACSTCPATPTAKPTVDPTAKPTANPTAEPTPLDPTARPTAQPTANPTTGPTAKPTAKPTEAPTSDGRSLEEALVRDFFDTLPSSDSCTGVGGTFSSTFTHTPSTSTWADESVSYEPKVFLAELSHEDPDPDKSWKIRVGGSGILYSFVGPFGESVPPQKHDGAPFIDEVWQGVAVDLSQNDQVVVPACAADDGQNCAAPFFIHQAGAYTNDKRFSGTESYGDLPYPELDDQPHYSPNVAKFCDYVRRECGFVSWGQQAHLPTPFKSELLYYTRYRDCGGGVLTRGMHNSVKSQDRIDYTNMPWGGVRTSKLSSVTVAGISGTSELDDALLDPNELDDPVYYIKDLDSLGGYTTFLEAYPITSSVVSPVTMQYNGWSNSRTTGLGFEVFFRFDATTTVPAGSSGPLEIRNQDGVVEEIASVRHWAWTGTTCYYVATDDQGLVRFRDKFSDGDVLTFWTPSGKPYEENKALSVVYGRSLDAPEDGDRLRVWSSQRDFTVWTANVRMATNNDPNHPWRPKLEGGGSLSARQFFVTGPYLGSYNTSRPLVEETAIEHEMPHTGTLSQVGLFAADGGSVVGAGLVSACAATPRCTGYSAPGAGRAPLFAISCGATHYVGDDLYHFEGAGLYSWDKVPWRCAGEPTTVRPTWTLLGYFDATDCQDVAAHEYVAGYCPP